MDLDIDRRQRIQAFLVVLVALLIGNEAPAVVDGEATDAQPAIVALGHSYPACSGIVVAPRIVLTSAHCVSQAQPTSVYFGPEPRSATEIRVLATRIHPDFVRRTHENDVAVVLLEADAPVAPLNAVNRVAAPEIGRSIRIVGYGRASEVEPGHLRRKRVGVMTIHEVSRNDFRATPDPSCGCSHDSGGAALIGDRLVGVVVGGDIGCRRFTTFARLDRHGEFLRRAIDDARACENSTCFAEGER